MYTTKPLQVFGSQAPSLRCSRSAVVTVRCSSEPKLTSQGNFDRRSLLLQLASVPTLASLLLPGTAAAENSYVTWWKSRRTVNGGAKLLNPLYVAQRRLRQASDLLEQSSQLGGEDLTAALQLVRSSSLNCYMFEALPDDTIETRASLLTQKYEFSVSKTSNCHCQ